MSADATTESADVEKVEAAVEALVAGKLDEAEVLLLDVIANTPANYSNIEETDEVLSIRFWDQAAFIHYIQWRQQRETIQKNITWVGNAYPRAHYYLGFLCVAQKQYQDALHFLNKGQALEPTNPKFTIEKAQALVRGGRKQEALALYDQVREVTEFVQGQDVAVAWRGRGFVLIELGDLDSAEAAFRTSLEFEPGNQNALGELQYIEHLRQGGATAPMQVVRTQSRNMSTCAACGESFEKGVVVSVDGTPTPVCDRCHRRLTKKWWQFWK